jgi:FKBP-type peptidyl-prolyl cis-trans isomerase SlyD
MTDVAIIGDGKVVAIHFTLQLDSGKTVATTEGQDPMLYLHGQGNIVPGLEAELAGKTVGDKLAVVVAPKDAYGEAEPGAMHEVPRDAFPDDFELEPGVMFQTEDEDGEIMPLWVVSASKESVKITNNHPLAGQTLNFAVEVLSIREASAEEVEHGHPHGEGGHHH